ncbi:MAG: hypothetical protein K2M02_07385 [Duncaniella sp.]|nr:hypothetical protein [Duncaniella sp.]MDE6495478.1 hypothetical protein [Duncaniella sp.]
MKENDILSKIGRNDGTTVPDGYFDDFATRMIASLPQQEWEREPVVLHRSVWQKIRPYIYLAAMFMGVWCMMKMVDLMRPDSGLSIDSNPLLTAAINNDEFINDYFLNETEVNDYQLIDDLYMTDFDPGETNEIEQQTL